jgi:hypothetical protein
MDLKENHVFYVSIDKNELNGVWLSRCSDGLRGWAEGDPFPAEAGDFSQLHNVQIGSGTHPPPI